MTGAVVAMGCVVVVAVVAVWRVAAAHRQLVDELGGQVARDIEPYLRRRAAEVGIGGDAPVWTSRHNASEKIDFSAELAQKLQRLASRDPRVSATALAQTMPVDDSQAVTARRPAPKGEGEK